MGSGLLDGELGLAVMRLQILLDLLNQRRGRIRGRLLQLRTQQLAELAQDLLRAGFVLGGQGGNLCQQAVCLPGGQPAALCGSPCRKT